MDIRMKYQYFKASKTTNLEADNFTFDSQKNMKIFLKPRIFDDNVQKGAYFLKTYYKKLTAQKLSKSYFQAIKTSFLSYQKLKK